MKRFEMIAGVMAIGLGVAAVGGCGRTRGDLAEPIPPVELAVQTQPAETQAEKAQQHAAKPAEMGEVIRSRATTAPTQPRAGIRPAGAIESAVLVVNRDHITADEVLRRIRPELESIAATYKEDVYERRAEGLIGQATRDLVSETLLYQEIAARITEEQDPVIDKVVEKEVTRLANQEAGGSLVRLEKLLREQDSNLDILRQQLRRQIVTQQYLRDRMKPKVIVTRDEMWEYYQEHMSEFSEPERVHLRLIEIDASTFLPEGVTWLTADSDQQRSARAKADERVRTVQEKLKAGEDFSKAAKDFSTGATGRVGGNVGWISRGSYRLKSLEDKAFTMSAGEVSEPTTLETKTYILQVEERKAGKTVGFCEAQEKVKGMLEQHVYRRLVMEHLAKLWEKSQIGDLPTFMEAVYLRLPAYETVREKALGKRQNQ